MRNLAHIETITNIQDIYLVESGKPADSIQLATVLGWKVVIKKGEYQVGDRAIYIEIDSIVPPTQPFAFLEPRKFKVKTMKLNKFYFGDNKDDRVISQGLLMQATDLALDLAKYQDSHDLTELLGITKIEDETKETNTNTDSRIKVLQKHHWFMKTKLAKYLMKFNFTRKILIKLFIPKKSNKGFPTYIVKTDETRIQALPSTFELWQGKPLQVVEKLDGTSTTFGLQKVGKTFDFAVCSRNVRQLDYKQKTWYLDAETNYYWEQAFKYNLKEVLTTLFTQLKAKDHVVIQGETVGPSIQGNKYKLKERDFYAFNLIVDGVKLDSVLGQEYLKDFGIKWCPILDLNFTLPSTIEETLKYANKESVLYPTLREGVVIRDKENKVSFKVINQEFLLKHNL